VKTYEDSEFQKEQIITENRGASGVYSWLHRTSKRRYIGSSVDITRRFLEYFSQASLTKSKGRSYIRAALRKYAHSAFSFQILEYVDIQNMSIKDAIKELVEREQYYFDHLPTEFNIQKVARSSLGRLHTEETKKKNQRSAFKV